MKSIVALLTKMASFNCTKLISLRLQQLYGNIQTLANGHAFNLGWQHHASEWVHAPFVSSVCAWLRSFSQGQSTLSIGMKYSMIIICFGRPSSLSFKVFLNSLLHRLQTHLHDQLDYFLHVIYMLYLSGGSINEIQETSSLDIPPTCVQTRPECTLCIVFTACTLTVCGSVTV